MGCLWGFASGSIEYYNRLLAKPTFFVHGEPV